MFFEAPYTQDNIRKQYKLLAKQLHPDKGGSTQKFQRMKKEYDDINEIIAELPNKKKVAPKKKVPVKKKAAIKKKKAVKKSTIKKVRAKKTILKVVKKTNFDVDRLQTNVNKIVKIKNVISDLINSVFG